MSKRRRKLDDLAPLWLLLALPLVVYGCAAQSAGEPPWLQETVGMHCPAGSVKECRVWGGNKFTRRYEYCGCRESR